MVSAYGTTDSFGKVDSLASKGLTGTHDGIHNKVVEPWAVRATKIIYKYKKRGEEIEVDTWMLHEIRDNPHCISLLEPFGTMSMMALRDGISPTEFCTLASTKNPTYYDLIFKDVSYRKIKQKIYSKKRGQ